MKNSNVKTFSTFAFILLMSCSNLVASNYRPFYEHSTFTDITSTSNQSDLAYNKSEFGSWTKTSNVSAVSAADTISRLEIKFTKDNTIGSFTTQRFFLVANAGQKFTFMVRQSNNSGSNKKLTVSIVNDQDQRIGGANLLDKIFGNAASSDEFFTINNTLATGTYRLKFEFQANPVNISNFDYRFWNLQTDLSLLPVNYSALSATQVLGTAQIKWTTSMEENNSHFEIEHSVDGENWNQIGSVEGAGFSTEEMSYSYTDYNTVQGANIYRLKQVDYDGKFSYSNHLFVLIGNKSPQDQIQLFPNPSKGMVTIKGVDSPKVTVFNTAGTALYVSHNQSSLNLDFLQLGVYFLQIESFDGKVTRHRFLKD